jgi:lysophospholipase L1-like esterase
MPELEVKCRQFGWSGEQAGGFLGRMENDVLRFKPDVATSCYGMNDFRYVPFDAAIAALYRQNLTAMAAKFRAAECDLLLGSPGIIDSVPGWVQSATGTQQDLNLALCQFRNIGIEVAAAGELRFADVYRPMLIADFEAKKAHGKDFKVAGKDGVHPGWAGQVVMAYAFLSGLGLDGDLGTIVIDGEKAQASGGHEVKSFADGKLAITSRRFPFSPGAGDVGNDDSVRAGLALVPFNAELNRLTLTIVQPNAANYSVKWGAETRDYSAEQLAAGVNLAADFVEHPLVAPFKKVWDAAARKQGYETRQMKELMHGPEGGTDMEATVALTEKVHANLAAVLAGSMQPAEHVIEIRTAD